MDEERGSSNLPAVAIAFVVGALAGAAVGLLMAPKPGREIRHDLKELGVDWGEKMAHVGTDAKTSAEEWFERAFGALAAAREAFVQSKGGSATGGTTPPSAGPGGEATSG